MKKKLYNIGLFCLVFLLTGSLYILFHNMKNDLLIQKSAYDVIELQPTKLVELKRQNEVERGFVCTGVCYDKKDKTFWTGNYGKNTISEKKQPSIILWDSGFERMLAEITLDEEIDVQGITYDSSSDTLWYSDGKNVVNCDKSGIKLCSFDLGKYSKYRPNGVAYDDSDDSLWVLCFYRYLLHYEKDGSLLSVLKMSYVGQDHICVGDDRRLYITIGEDYEGENNFVVQYSMEEDKIEKVYRVKKSYAIEGICFVEDEMIITNDGLYHNANINKNYVCYYRLP